MLFIFLEVQEFTLIIAQSPWPSETWDAAVNLTQVMNTEGLTNLSGLHWNPDLNRLYIVDDNGSIRVLEQNASNSTFAEIANIPIEGGPEDITQVNYRTDEFYTIDENNYEIRKYTYTANFSSLLLAKSWNLLKSPSPMNKTGNTGPEGIAFVPDNFLIAAGFISQSSGQLYTSKKGMGGLLFIAHQDEGYIWVFDVNPSLNNDFAYVGKYKTNKEESCDLEFDRSTGLLYILHNIENNTLEITDLKSTLKGNDQKFNIIKEYSIANPTDNINLEGFALSPKCPNSDNVSVWLCRDVESTESQSIQNECIKWFNPYIADGNCNLNSINPIIKENKFQINVFPNPASHSIKISISYLNLKNASIRVIDSQGRITIEKERISGGDYLLDISNLNKGLYLIEIYQENYFSTIKWLKN